MEPHESKELIEKAHEVKEHSNKWTALGISVLAMFLAINHVGGGNSSKEATRHNIEASNYYAFYQAKSIKQTELRVATERLELELKVHPDLSSSAVDEYQKLIASYNEKIKSYESDEKSSEGKKELLEKAKEHESERDHALTQDPWFDYAEGILQISIVLLSISVLAGLPIMTIFGASLGGIGLLCMLNGFFLFMRL